MRYNNLSNNMMINMILKRDLTFLTKVFSLVLFFFFIIFNIQFKLKHPNLNFSRELFRESGSKLSQKNSFYDTDTEFLEHHKKSNAAYSDFATAFRK